MVYRALLVKFAQGNTGRPLNLEAASTVRPGN